jgi:DNA-binding transcriptional LysR family regulator
VLTDAGQMLLAHAIRLLALNDEAVEALRGAATEGVVRFGLPIDFAESWLAIALARFGRGHPLVRFEAVVDRNRRLLEQLDQGELDLALTIHQVTRRDATPIGTLPLAWIGPARDPGGMLDDHVPLAVLEAPCFFRDAALAALDRAGVRWRIVFTSPSIHALFAAVEAGLAVTLRTPLALPPGLRVWANSARLPHPLTLSFGVSLHDGGRELSAAAGRLRDIVRETFTAHPLQQ